MSAMPLGQRRIVVLGMMTKIPVAGVVWQTLHYLLGFRRLGFDTYYVEAHARTPGMLMSSEHEDSAGLAASFLDRTLSPFGLGDKWAFHSLHGDGRVYGMTERELRRLYGGAEVLLNLHGGTEPQAEHAETGRLVYLETDPVQLQVELYERQAATLAFLEPHVAFFTFGENYGKRGCGLPVSETIAFRPTRQPVVLDCWLGAGPDEGAFTTIGNWRQPWRDVQYRGERYTWSKDEEFRKFLLVPARTGMRFELALSSYGDADRELLEARGWRVRHALDFSTDRDAYREYVQRSRGEFTVAKDQNVRLCTGWFSDRSATYLAAGRPVITQDTGFGDVLPTGAGLFPFTTLDDIVAAVETIEADYGTARRAAFETAREFFDAGRVLGQLLDEVGVGIPGRARRSMSAPFPATLDLVPVSRRPTVLPAETLATALGRPIPDTGGDCLGRRRRDVTLVVVASDGLAFTRLCVESVLANTRSVDVELVVVDNASSDGTAEYLCDLTERDSRVHVLRNEVNRGFAAAVNQGLADSTGDVLVVLNNDVVVPPDWLPRLVRQLERPEVGLVGPTTNRAGNEAEVEAGYGTYGELVEFADRRAREHAGVSFEIEVATLFCAAMRRDVFERVGLLDERFEVGLFEDDDYSARVRAAGLRVVCAEDAFLHHFGEASLGGLVTTGTYGEVFRANQARFENKWGTRWEPHVGRPQAWYRELVERLRSAVDSELPDDAIVLVVSNGDDALVQLGASRRGWHFPQMADGTYAGHHPGDSAEAIRHLEALRRRGAQFIVFPRTAFWWLDYYDTLADHLGPPISPQDADAPCAIYAVERGLANADAAIDDGSARV